jgi:cytochrome P450
LFNLLTHPKQLEAVKKDRRMVGAAIEESLRFEPPIQYPPRTATREVVIGGVTVPEGSIVIPVLSAANRDPALNESPDEFNIFRARIRHITFGSGVHTCFGMHLARLESQLAVNRLFDRLPGLRLDSEKATKLDSHVRGKTFRSPTSVPVRWDV